MVQILLDRIIIMLTITVSETLFKGGLRCD